MGQLIAYVNALQIALVAQQAEIRDLSEKLMRSASLLDQAAKTINTIMEEKNHG